MEGYVDVLTAAALTGEAEQRVREKIARGVYKTVKRSGQRGGTAGESYLVKVASLPRPAQVKYQAQLDRVPYDFDYAGFRQRYGEEGEDRLLRKLDVVREGRALQAMRTPDLVSELDALAAEYGTSSRTLRRWINAYNAEGPAGLAFAVSRSDKGMHKSLCLAAEREAYGLYLATNKRTKTTVYEKLGEMKLSYGPNACARCLFNEANPAREMILGTEAEAEYPPCADPNKAGLIIPESRQTMGRILGDIPDDMIVLARRGAHAWKADHMTKATRAKPSVVNQIWVGDHHQFDCFVLNSKGRAVRPWLTAWMDAATGAIPGWVLCEQPCTDTILDAFITAVGHTDTPFYGLPAEMYINCHPIMFADACI